MDELLTDVDLDEPSEKRPPKTRRIEQLLVLMANSVWAVAGLVLWIPQIVRVVLTSAFRLIHAALTRQPIEGIRGPIRQVSRFYVDGFLSLGDESKTDSYSARQLQIGRFLLETLWVVLVWLAVLRVTNPLAFAALWNRFLVVSVWLWDRASRTFRLLVESLPETMGSYLDLSAAMTVVLVVLMLISLLAGFILGRRR